jgi:hypothetical protein
LVELGLVVVVLGEVLDGLVGVAGVLGVTAGPFGVVVAPVEVDPGVMDVPAVPVVVEDPLAPVFEDCGTADPLAGTQFEVAVEVLGVVLALGDVEEVVELLLGEALLVELVLAVELGDALLELGMVLLVEVLGVEVVELIEPVALALVLGTMPAGQLLVEDALGVLDGVVEVLAPVCDEVVDEAEGVVVLVVVDVVCAATHVAPAVRINTNVSFFIFSSS